jgi:quinol monooxygenase YgiN
VDRDGSAVGALPRAEEIVVHARTTQLQADRSKVDDGIAYVRDEVIPAVTAMEGCVGMSLLVDRESGQCIATTAWQTEEAMAATADRVRPVRERAEQILGASTSDVDQWEVAVVHRDHASPEGACARVTWVSGATGGADRVVDVYRMAILPRLQELEGFCSASLMTDRMTNRAVGTVIFDSREALERSRDATAAIRGAAMAEMGANIDRVGEMEVALAHLHVPEMA